MAYVSALLWFAFLMLSTTALAAQTLLAPEYFFTPKQLFPFWPEWHPALAIGLVSATATLLFLPKLLSLLLILKDDVRHFGSGIGLVLSVLAESVLSMLLAPIRMLWHTTFVVGALMGWSARWQSPARDNSETTWGDGLRRHALGTLLGLVWAGGVYWLSPAFFWWLLPVVGALILSIPLSVYSSRTSLGRRLRKARLFLIPEEIRPPKELEWTRQYLNRAMTPPGFMEAVVDPIVNALVCASGRIRTKQSVAVRSEHERIGRIALHEGPEALTIHQKTALLSDPLALARLHLQVWTSLEAHPRWLAAQTSGGNANRDVQGHARVSGAHLPRCRFH
jgi:membrane glycosyltransferase